MPTFKMKQKSISAIRDCALSYEKKDITIAYELMQLAHELRPEGEFIKKKAIEYKKTIDKSLYRRKMLNAMVQSGEIAIIPIGFRCFTAQLIKRKLGVTQASLPFNSGFFSPHSIASVFKNPEVNLQYPSEQTSHSVCIKYENQENKNKEKGIDFIRSDYHTINNLVTTDRENINNYLDSTFGYYTLDETHKFILAHYNWHHFASEKLSNGVTLPSENLKKINKILNKRIDRMLETCENSKKIFFIASETQGYKYIKIDNEVYNLSDFSELKRTLSERYKNIEILSIDNLNGPGDILSSL